VDCNVAGGSYEVDGNSLSIEVGLSTLAYCGDDSLDQAYLTMLSSVESYALEDGKLLLELADGAGRMLFE
jgi:heat shock protein HslJ